MYMEYRLDFKLSKLPEGYFYFSTHFLFSKYTCFCNTQCSIMRISQNFPQVVALRNTYINQLLYVLKINFSNNVFHTCCAELLLCLT